MKKYILSIVFCIGCSCLVSAEMSVEEQNQIIENYMYVTGQLDKSQVASYEEQFGENELPGKCGMSAVSLYTSYYDKFDPQIIKSSGVQTHNRPDFLTNTVESPSGKFLIHFTTTGEHAVYSNVPGGAFGYIDSVALIMDYVYEHIIDTLGYPEPVPDSFYASGGDEKFDIYMVNLPTSFYGLTYADSILFNNDPNSITSTAYIELENDYNTFSNYKNRPLDAIRVTAAHEFFHMVQFAIDKSETEEDQAHIFGPAWMEMSSVWMEEEIYDEVNDYYLLLPAFFSQPWASLQQFKLKGSHPYASGIFPMFLSQKYDRDIVKAIWIMCGDSAHGPGADFIQVLGEVIDSVSSGTESMQSVMAEFALWNYFTGSRSGLAPIGVGYEEKDNYNQEFREAIQDGEIGVEFNYPKFVSANDNARAPFSNGAFYLKLLNVDNLVDKFVCLDSTITINGIDTTIICNDSATFFSIAFSLDPGYPNPWGGSIIYRYKAFSDSIDVDTVMFPPGSGSSIGLRLLNPSQYSSITFVLSASSNERGFYLPNNEIGLAYVISSTVLADSLNSDFDASIFFPYPNPAVYNEMSDKVVNFKFQYPTDSLGFAVNLTDPLVGDPFMIIDIFNINGEHVNSISNISDSKSDIFSGLFVSEWDMKNKSGKDISSGVYLAYARLYDGDIDGKLLFETRTKLAVIR